MIKKKDQIHIRHIQCYMIKKCCSMTMAIDLVFSSTNNDNEEQMQISNETMKVWLTDWIFMSNVLLYTCVVYHQLVWQFLMLAKSQQNFLKIKSQTEKACVLCTFLYVYFNWKLCCILYTRHKLSSFDFSRICWLFSLNTKHLLFA